MKYYKKGLCKVLSIILAVAMLLTSPIGITQAYALEDGQPAVEDSQEELPLGASEILDSDIQSKASAAPVFAEGYPKPGAVKANGSKEIEVLVKGVLPEGVDEMGLYYVLLADDDPAPTS